SERQRCTGSGYLPVRQYPAGTNAVHVERGVSKSAGTSGTRRSRRCGNTKKRADLIVHAGKIRAVRDVESFGREDHVHPLAQFVLPAQTHVPIIEVGPETRIA